MHFPIKFEKRLGLLLETSINADLVVSLSKPNQSDCNNEITVSSNELSVPESVSAFLVHKIVLCARSKFLFRQFSNCQMLLRISSSSLISAANMPLLLHFFYSVIAEFSAYFCAKLCNFVLKHTVFTH